jgi:hypothetical protein
MAIKALQAIVGGKPDKAVGILRHIVDGIGGKASGCFVMGKSILLRLLAPARKREKKREKKKNGFKKWH